jgi:ATP-dependent RNA helicase DDX31/DBP7
VNNNSVKHRHSDNGIIINDEFAAKIVAARTVNDDDDDATTHHHATKRNRTEKPAAAAAAAASTSQRSHSTTQNNGDGDDNEREQRQQQDADEQRPPASFFYRREVMLDRGTDALESLQSHSARATTSATTPTAAAAAAAAAATATPPQSDDVIFSSSAFTALGLTAAMCRNIADNLKLERPTVVQQEAIAHLVAHRDVMLKGKTGLGKVRAGFVTSRLFVTAGVCACVRVPGAGVCWRAPQTLCFLLPIIDWLQAQEAPRVSREQGTYAVVLAPTKELAAQIFDEARRVVAHAFHWLVPGMLSGGRKKKAEKASLRKGVSLLVATPGRLLDHLRTTSAFRCAPLRYLVLDEADRLLDAGFERDLSEIVSVLRERAHAPDSIQTVLTSATVHAGVASAATRVARMRNPLFIDADARTTRAPASSVPAAAATPHDGDRTAAAAAAAVGGDGDADERRDTKRRRRTRDSAADNDDGSANERSERDGGDDGERVRRDVAADNDDEDEEEDHGNITMPSQLQQHFVVVPYKLRLVALTAFVRLLAASR